MRLWVPSSPSLLFTTLLIVMICCVWPASTLCPEADQIHCQTSDRCTRIRYICDGDNDCGDNSDEASSLCGQWRNNDCDRNSALCRRNGRNDCVTIQHYCSINNPSCNGTVDPRLCQMLHDGKIQPLHTIQLSTTTPAPTIPPTTEPSIHISGETWTEEFLARMGSTIKHQDCDQLYTKVGNQCMSVFFMGSMSWMEARAFCTTIGGDLLTITDNNFGVFATVVQHLRGNQVTSDFWVGGKYVNDTVGWNWVDDTPMLLGSPYWAVRHHSDCQTRTIKYQVLNLTTTANNGRCYNYVQAPSDPPHGHCASLTYQHYHYITDDDCFVKKSPLCVMPGKVEEQAL